MVPFIFHSTIFGIIIFSASARNNNILTSLNPDCPTDCQDTATNCLENLAACFDPTQYTHMFQTCRCTCSYCPDSETKCQDVDPECATKAYECKNDRYKPLMCKYCRKTCRLCDDPCSLLP